MSIHNPKRRTVLRAILAGGCALCVSPVLAAENTQPKAKKPGEMKGGKVSKPHAKYQNKPKGNLKCANCNNFIAPDSCRVVDGKVSPDGWCVLYAPKVA